MTLQELLQQAVPLQQAGRFDEAEKLYDQMLALEPANYAALHLMGVLRLQQGRLQLDRFVSARYPLEGINEAIAAMRDGATAGRVMVEL